MTNQAEATYSVKLTASEMLLLDGRCSADTQRAVDTARLALELENSGLSSEHRKMVAEAVADAKKNGKLTYRRTSLRYCSMCAKSAGYALYRSGPNRGQENIDKPLSMSGVDLHDSFVIMSGHASIGGCLECVQACLPTLRQLLSDVAAELPKELRNEVSALHKRHRNKKCSACGWAGHEGQMGDMPAIMGGSYKGKCPQCGAENLPLGRTIIETVDGFTVVEERG